MLGLWGKYGDENRDANTCARSEETGELLSIPDETRGVCGRELQGVYELPLNPLLNRERNFSLLESDIHLRDLMDRALVVDTRDDGILDFDMRNLNVLVTPIHLLVYRDWDNWLFSLQSHVDAFYTRHRTTLGATTALAERRAGGATGLRCVRHCVLQLQNRVHPEVAISGVTLSRTKIRWKQAEEKQQARSKGETG